MVKKYKIILVDMTLVSNISKFQTIPYQNEGVIVFSIKGSQSKEQPGTT